MIRFVAALFLCFCYSATAWSQTLVYPAYPQPPAPAFYNQGPFGGVSPYGYGATPYGLGGYGYGYGNFGYGNFGYGNFGYGGLGYGGFGYGGAVGYYPLNALGNLNWLPPNRPSPYYFTPSTGEYLEQVRRREQAVYADILLRQPERR